MQNKVKIIRTLIVLISLAIFVSLAGCGGGGGEKDTTTDEVVEDESIGEDTGVEEISLEPQEEEDAVSEMDMEEPQEISGEDIVEEEVQPTRCPVLTPGTASLGGILKRGDNMIVNPSDSNLDAAGSMIIAVFNEDPVQTYPRPDPVASTRISSVVLTELSDTVEFCLQNIPPGPYWFGALLDDDNSGLSGQESFGDIITGPPVEGTLAANEAVQDADFVLNVRVGRVWGEITIDPTLAGSHSDLTGNLYVLIVDSVAPSATLLGGSLYQNVTLSPDASFPYEVLLPIEPTSTNTGYVVVIFDVDLSGVRTGPQNGDLVNFSLSPTVILPPHFEYLITGIEENIDTEVIWEYNR